MYYPLSDKVATGLGLAEARKLGAVLDYGNFITLVINFIIVAFCIFLMVKALNKHEKTGSECARHGQGLPGLHDVDPGQGNALPALHDGTVRRLGRGAVRVDPQDTARRTEPDPALPVVLPGDAACPG